jgi:hypothetical protein
MFFNFKRHYLFWFKAIYIDWVIFSHYHMVEIIQKDARKTSPDPVQEALRGHKDTWNHEASLLIAQLIAFKRGLNGRGEPKVGLPPGSIKDPIPSEVGSYLDQLADRYNKLISDAHSIIDEQAHYSEGRKKSSKETEGQPVVASADDEIMKIASWWGSRVKTYTKNNYTNPWYWFAAKEEAKIRMKLLKISTDFTRKLKDIDGFVLSKDSKSIPNAIYSFDKFVSGFSHLMFSNVEKLVKIDKQVMPAEVEKANVETEKPKENKVKNETKEVRPENDTTTEQKVEEENKDKELPNNILELSGEESAYVQRLSPEQIQIDLMNTGAIALIMQKLKYSEKFCNNFKTESAEVRKKLDHYNLSGSGSIDEIQLGYGNLLKSSNSILKLNSQSFSSQLKEIQKLVNMKAASISPEFEKLASNFMARWLKRQKLKIMPNSNDRVRLLTSDKVKKTLQNLNSFQDSLENNEHLNMIMSEFTDLSESIGDIGESLYHLGKNNNDEHEQAKLNGRPPTFLIKAETLNKLAKLKDYFAEALRKITA